MFQKLQKIEFYVDFSVATIYATDKGKYWANCSKTAMFPFFLYCGENQEIREIVSIGKHGNNDWLKKELEL